MLYVWDLVFDDVMCEFFSIFNEGDLLVHLFTQSTVDFNVVNNSPWNRNCYDNR